VCVLVNYFFVIIIVVNKVAMKQIIANNNNIVLLLLDEEEEEEVNRYNLLLTSKKRNSINQLFTTRVVEGFFEVLIKGHLNDNKKNFVIFSVQIMINLFLYYH